MKSTPADTLARGLQTQGRVIHALILREIRTRFGDQRLGYLWAVIEPISFVTAFVLILTAGGRHAPSGMPVIPFMITGILPFFLFRDTLSVTMQAVQSNRTLLTFPQVSLVDLVVARGLLEIVTTLVVFTVILIGAAIIGLPITMERPVEVYFWIIMMGLLGFGMGTTFGALAPLFRSVDRLVPALLTRPLFWISGVFFTAEMLPDSLREIAMLNGVFQLLELIRSAFFHEFESEAADPRFAILSVIGAVLLGLLVQRALRKRILIAVQAL